MRGSIKAQSKNSYRIRISTGKDAKTGKYGMISETVKGTRTQADKRLRELLTDLDKGIFVKPGKITLSQYMERWLSDNIKPNLAGNTYNLYAFLCKKHIFPDLGNITLIDLKPHHLQRFYAEKKASGLSSRTVQLLHVVLHKALKNAVKTNLLSRNVAEVIDPPKNTHHEMKVMNQTDLHLFLEIARDTEYYALFYTLLFTGMRRNEALALRWSDVDLLLCQLWGAPLRLDRIG